MKLIIAALVLLTSMSASAVRLEIQSMSGQYQDHTKKAACARALANLKENIKQTCADVEGRLTNEWSFRINHAGMNLNLCTVHGSAICEVAI